VDDPKWELDQDEISVMRPAIAKALETSRFNTADANAMSPSADATTATYTPGSSST
jgi:hypothetical protein